MAEPETSTRSPRPDSREGGRKRYVGFLIRGREFKRGEFIHFLNRLTRRGEPSPWLSFFEGGAGIIRCTDRNRDLMLEILGRAGKRGNVTLEPVVTSGTIKKVKSVLKEHERQMAHP